MTDFANELESAARLTQRLVQGLRWLEHQGPSEGRLASIKLDIDRMASDFGAALDRSNTATHGKEIDKLRGLSQSVLGLVQRLGDASRDLHLRIHVLDALERLEAD